MSDQTTDFFRKENKRKAEKDLTEKFFKMKRQKSLIGSHTVITEEKSALKSQKPNRYEQRKEEEVGRISVKSEMKGKNFLSVQFDYDRDTITKRMFAEERFYRGEQITRDKKLV